MRRKHCRILFYSKERDIPCLFHAHPDSVDELAKPEGVVLPVVVADHIREVDQA